MTDLNVISSSIPQDSTSLDKKSAVSALIVAKAEVGNQFAGKVPKSDSDASANVSNGAETSTNQLEQQYGKNNTIRSDELETAMDSLNAKLENLQSYLRFEKDEDTEKMVIFIKNSETGEVIRQIPSNEFLEISKNITQFFEVRQQLSNKMAMPTGLLADAKA